MIHYRGIAFDDTIHSQVASISRIGNFSIFQCLDGSLDGI
jgi:hypothetical protein